MGEGLLGEGRDSAHLSCVFEKHSCTPSCECELLIRVFHW